MIIGYFVFCNPSFLLLPALITKFGHHALTSRVFDSVGQRTPPRYQNNTPVDQRLACNFFYRLCLAKTIMCIQILFADRLGWMGDTTKISQQQSHQKSLSKTSNKGMSKNSPEMSSLLQQLLIYIGLELDSDEKTQTC